MRKPGFHPGSIPSLGWADPLETEMATHSWILAWRIPWTEKPGGLRSMGSQSQTQLSNKHFHCQWDRIPPRWLFDLGHQLFYTFGLFLGLKPTVFRLRFVSLALVGFQLASCGYWNFSILMICRLIPYNRSLYTHTHTHTHTHTFYFSEEPRIIHWVKCQGLGRVQHIGWSSGLAQSCWGLEQWVGKSSCEASDVRTDQVEWGIAFLKRYLTSSMSFYFTWKENKEKNWFKKKDRLSVRNRRQWGNIIHFINYLSGQEQKKHSFCFHSFFSKYLPRTYHGPSVILGGEETSGNKVPTFKDGGRERNADNKQMLLHAYFYEEK